MRRRWAVLFALSVVLNAGLIGFIAGDLSRPVQALLALREANRNLPQEMRREVRRALFADRGAILEDAAALRQARETYFGLMAAETLDRGALEAAAEKVRAATSIIQERLQERTIEVVHELPAATRAKIEPPTPLVPSFDGEEP